MICCEKVGLTASWPRVSQHLSVDRQQPLSQVLCVDNNRIEELPESLGTMCVCVGGGVETRGRDAPSFPGPFNDLMICYCRQVIASP